MNSTWRLHRYSCDPWYSPSMLRATSDGLVNYLSYTWQTNPIHLKQQNEDEVNESKSVETNRANNTNNNLILWGKIIDNNNNCEPKGVRRAINGTTTAECVAANNRCCQPLFKTVTVSAFPGNSMFNATLVANNKVQQPPPSSCQPVITDKPAAIVVAGQSEKCKFLPPTTALSPPTLQRPLAIQAGVNNHHNYHSVNHRRFCQTKIVELWRVLSSNFVKAEQTLHGDLWLPPNETDFEIDFKTGDTVKTVLALRTPIWPPNVTKILLICVKKIPCGKDDSCLRRLRDQTRWMKNDLHNHVAAYKSFRQLKYNNADFWYLPRHSCEFNLERFINSSLYSPTKAEFLVRDMFHGLNYLHMQTQHLFHGNLKPNNVLIDLKSDNRLSLILVDFGFGRLRCPKVGALNEIRCCYGNGGPIANGLSRKMDDLCWKPPEFFDSSDRWSSVPPKYDTPSDVYSAALLSYFMMSRRHAFVNRADMTLLHLRRAMHEECFVLDHIDVEIQTALRPLFRRDAKLRPRAADVLKQPICWTAESRGKFLSRVAETLTQKNRLDSRVGVVLATKPWRQFDDWCRQIPDIVRCKMVAVLQRPIANCNNGGNRLASCQQKQSSVAAWLLAVNFYRQAKRNNDIPQSFVCPCLPDDDHQFFLRYPTLFWDVFRIVNNDAEWKSLKLTVCLSPL